jgi:hypothetical protein
MLLFSGFRRPRGVARCECKSIFYLYHQAPHACPELGPQSDYDGVLGSKDVLLGEWSARMAKLSGPAPKDEGDTFEGIASNILVFHFLFSVSGGTVRWQHARSLQLGVLRLRSDEDRDVGVGVLP